MKVWLKAFRLRTLPLSFSTILLGNALAFYSLSPSEIDRSFSWTVFSLTLITTLFLQILSNLANDYGDATKGADNENRIGPKRAIQSGAISLVAMRNAILIFVMLSLVSGIALLLVSLGSEFNYLFLLFLVLGILSIAAAIKYTVGKRAYGYSGLGDVFVFIFFGLVGVSGAYFLQQGSFSPEILLPAVTMGSFSVAVLNLNNMRDRVNDQAVGKNTLVVLLGAKNAKIYHGLLFVLAYVAWFGFAWMSSSFLFFALASLPVGVFHAIHLLRIYRICDPKEFDPELKKIALSAFLFALLVWAANFLAINP